jgi:hypothetical protein
MTDFQLSVPSCAIVPHQPFGYTTGLIGALSLDRHREIDIYELCTFFHRQQSHAGANCRTRSHRRWETHPVQPIVDAYPNSLPDPNSLSRKKTQKRKREEAVSNGGAVWRLTRGPFRIKVNPLPVFGRVGEFLDAFLRQNEPLRRGQFTAFEFFQRIQMVNFEGRHGNHDDPNRNLREDKRLSFSL